MSCGSFDKILWESKSLLLKMDIYSLFIADLSMKSGDMTYIDIWILYDCYIYDHFT
jgi:hypothetical protein